MTKLLGIALCGALALGACDDHDHDHDHEHDASALIEQACGEVTNAGTALTASTDPSDANGPSIQPGAGPITVTIPAGEMGYVWIETTRMHVDGAIFANKPNVVTALVNPTDGLALSLVDEGAPARCPADILADYRVHIHEPQRYRLELDGDVATEVWLDVLDQDSDHSPTTDERNTHM